MKVVATRLYRSSNRAGLGLLYRAPEGGRRNEPHDWISFRHELPTEALPPSSSSSASPSAQIAVSLIQFAAITYRDLCTVPDRLISGSRASYDENVRGLNKRSNVSIRDLVFESSSRLPKRYRVLRVGLSGGTIWGMKPFLNSYLSHV